MARSSETLGCTLWPDEWFGTSIHECCVQHDLSKLELQDHVNLMICVAQVGADAGQTLLFGPMSIAMFIAVVVCAPIILAARRRRQK